GLAAPRDRQDGRRPDVELLDRRRIDPIRQVGLYLGYFVPYFLHRLVDRDLELELDDNLGDALEVDRPEHLDARERVDRLLDGIADFALHRGGVRPGIHHGHRDDRKLDVGEQVDADPRIRERPEHDQRRDEHHGEDRPADEDVRESHNAFPFWPPEALAAAGGAASSFTSASMPGRSFSSPFSTVQTISTVLVITSIAGLMRKMGTTRSTPIAGNTARSVPPGARVPSTLSGKRTRSSSRFVSCTTTTVVGGIIVTASPTFLRFSVTTPSMGERTIVSASAFCATWSAVSACSKDVFATS